MTPTTITAEHIAARERFLDAAIARGKFPPSRRFAYGALYDADPQAAERIVGKLAIGLVPEQTAALRRAHTTTTDSYPSGWLNEGERRRIGAAHSGPADRVTKADD